MSVKRSPPVSPHPSLNLSSSQYGPVSSLNKTQNDEEKFDSNVTKRQQRTFCDYSVNSSSSMAEIKAMISELKSQQELKLDHLATSMNTLLEQNIDIRKSIEFMSHQYDELLLTTNKLEKENAEHKKHIKNLENRLELFEKNSRSTSIEIRNIPKQQQETKQTIFNIVRDIGSVLCLDSAVRECEIRDIYRAKSEAIVVDFTTTERKETLLTASKSYNKSKREKREPQLNTHLLKIQGPTRTIFISEFLTPTAKRLYFLAREHVKNKKLLSTWTSYGKVYVRGSEGQVPIRITEEAELNKLIL